MLGSQIRTLFILLFFFFAAFNLNASPVFITLTQEEKEGDIIIAAEFVIEKGWHIYGKNPGDIGLPLTIDWNIPEGYTMEPLEWPMPETFSLADMVGYGYSNKVTLLSRLMPSHKTDSQNKLMLTAHITYLACNDESCQPGQETRSLHLITDRETTSNGNEVAAVFSLTEDKPPFQKKDLTPPPSEGLLLTLCFAFLGGFILNLMPCVLPVISLKIMSFVKIAGEKRSVILQHSLLFSLGVLLSFWALASIMILLRHWGHSVGWGFQLQEPLFVLSLATLLFIFALNLFGVFEWGLSVASWAGQTTSNQTKSASFFSSFFSGVLATAVATPCTGPFLGSAVGFAVTLSPIEALLIFTCIALGMCSPYLLLSAFPSALRFLPKPGSWMETFKQLMGFLLFATVLWLLWVFGAQTSSFAIITVLFGFLFFAIAAWIYGKGTLPTASKKMRLLAYLSTLIFVFFGSKALMLSSPEWSAADQKPHSKSALSSWEGWEEFSPHRLHELKQQGIPVLIDFTAKWCLICQANHLVLSSDHISTQIDHAGIVKMKADWTKNDPTITAELAKFGRSSVPLYVLYGRDDEKPQILPQVLTPDVIASHIEPIAKKSSVYAH